ncbi:MAG TPA: SPFH domain-containing protein [Acidimicrobiia bacterium]|nr:SPFH domain-containing protein [Acidimicrobiia bacterium]
MTERQSMSEERLVVGVSGWLMASVSLILLVGGGIGFVGALVDQNWWVTVTAAVILLVGTVLLLGLFVNQPNQSRVVTLFGRYHGTVRENGFRWVNPLTLRRSVSLRIRTFDSDVLKVNDAVGNPVEIASVINWQVVDTARAAFDVEDYEHFVKVQSEAAIRHVASEYPYDHIDDEGPSLRANADDVTSTLQRELQDRLDEAGVTVRDCRLRRLAYAPEIAGEMLRRQQAGAVIAARKLIVRGAVTMVQDALQQLAAENIVELDEERKAAMVSNLMVVLTGDHSVQPVVNTGTLYTG